MSQFYKLMQEAENWFSYQRARGRDVAGHVGLSNSPMSNVHSSHDKNAYLKDAPDVAELNVFYDRVLDSSNESPESAGKNMAHFLQKIYNIIINFYIDEEVTDWTHPRYNAYQYDYGEVEVSKLSVTQQLDSLIVYFWNMTTYNDVGKMRSYLNNPRIRWYSEFKLNNSIFELFAYMRRYVQNLETLANNELTIKKSELNKFIEFVKKSNKLIANLMKELGNKWKDVSSATRVVNKVQDRRLSIN